jgi:hypothetical protein
MGEGTLALRLAVVRVRLSVFHCGVWMAVTPVFGIKITRSQPHLDEVLGGEFEGSAGTLFHRFLDAMDLVVFVVSMADLISCGAVFLCLGEVEGPRTRLEACGWQFWWFASTTLTACSESGFRGAQG